MSLADRCKLQPAISRRREQHACTGTLLFVFAPMCAGSVSCSLYIGGGAACACLAAGRATFADLLRPCRGRLATCLVNVVSKLALPILFPARR